MLQLNSRTVNRNKTCRLFVSAWQQTSFLPGNTLYFVFCLHVCHKIHFACVLFMQYLVSFFLSFLTPAAPTVFLLLLLTLTSLPLCRLLNHTLSRTPSQHTAKLSNWPSSQVEFEQLLLQPPPDSLSPSVKKELKIIEFIRKKEPRSLVFPGSRK